jgi:ER-derived vesicles protein
MAQIRGTAGYNLGLQNQFGGPSRGDATSDPSPLDAIREQTSKIEDWLNTAGEPIKPCVYRCQGFSLSVVVCDPTSESLTILLLFSRRYLPAIGRFLIVVTFLEDALRILTQWNDQLLYLHDFRHSMG